MDIHHRRPGLRVSRGGRPDLAEDSLGAVRAPTLLIVGGRDDVVIELNRQAFARLKSPKELQTVPNATHLFEEPGPSKRYRDSSTCMAPSREGTSQSMHRAEANPMPKKANPRIAQKHPEQRRGDLSPDRMAGQNIGGVAEEHERMSAFGPERCNEGAYTTRRGTKLIGEEKS